MTTFMRVGMLICALALCAGVAAAQTGESVLPGPPSSFMPPSPPIGPTSLEPDVSRPGADYRTLVLPRADVELCRNACDYDGRCHAYTYAHPGFRGPSAVCWLKSSVPAPVSDKCCISGRR
jgi:hypothetical protein